MVWIAVRATISRGYLDDWLDDKRRKENIYIYMYIYFMVLGSCVHCLGGGRL